MRYKPTGRDIVAITTALYEKYGFIADQLPAHREFPLSILEHWKKAGRIEKSVTAEMFAYVDCAGQRIQHNDFMFGRISLAIGKGGDCFEDFATTALDAPLLKPNEYAIRVAGGNMRSYLTAMGGNDLLRHHDEILRMTVAYHSSELYVFVRDEEKKRALGEKIPTKIVDSVQGFASELYHKIPIDFDWEAAASFIINETTAQGEGLKLQKDFGPNKKVYKSHLPTACDVCKRLYLEEDGTPKLFEIKALLSNSSLTIPQRVLEDSSPQLPTCGPSHLYCTCSGPYAYTGYEPWANREVLKMGMVSETMADRPARTLLSRIIAVLSKS